MSSDLVSQQFPVSDRQLVHMDHVPDKPESSVSEMQMAGNMPNNAILHDFPVSNGPMNPVESVPSNGNRFGNSLVSVHQFGQMEYRTGVQPSSLIPGSASQQFVLSNKQGVIGNMSANIGVQKLSVPSKRKAEAELLLHGSPRQSSLPNKRVVDAGSFSHFSGRVMHSSQNKKPEQVQPKASTTPSQVLPVSSRKVVRNESLPNKTGPQRAQAPKGRSIQVDPISKNQTGSFNAVRSKMRESLAGALAMACKRKEDAANPAKDGNDGNTAQQLPVDSQPLEGNPSSDGACSQALQKSNDAVPTTEPLTSGKPGDTEEFSIRFPANETMQVSGPGFTELAVEDIPFSDNFFVKDELLQGNGLSWVMDLEMEARGMNEVEDASNPKVANEDVQEGFVCQTKASPEDLAFLIEAELFKLFGGVNKKYKEKGRSLLFNLKDPNNPELREKVMSGDILPERLCSMTAEELASKELSEWRTAKAEELASMVVLPDNDADMRRLVKKTHKGEYQVEFDRDDKVDNIAAEISAGATSITRFQRKSKVAKAKATSGAGEKESSAEKSSAEKQELSESLVIPADGTDLMQGMMVDEFKEADFLPPIVTLDEFMESLDSEPPFENLPVDSSQSTPPSDKEGTVTGIKARSTDSTSKGHSNAASEGKPGEVLKRQAEPVNKQVQPEAVHKSVSNVTAKKASPTGNASLAGSIWEGALQLTISTSVTVNCYFRSGETTSTKEWPNSLEVKGRVRIDAFEKFIEQLPMSRSRAVMVTQFALKDKSSEDERIALSEAVDSYVSDSRLGFAEPAPGVELYLCPPNGRVVDMLIKHLSKDRSELHDSTTDNALIGVVVWRKHHISSTISPNSSTHKHNFKKQQSMSRRPQEKDANVNNNVNFLPKGSMPSKPASLPDVVDDDDDDIPPGFGPPKGSRDDDDLPEFNFAGNMNASSVSRYPQPPARTHPISSSAPAADQMRQLVQKYGQTGNNTVPGGFGIEPWNDDDDDDDIPEWRPQAPLSHPNLRPPPGPAQAQAFHHQQQMHHPHLAHSRMQTPHHPQNVSPRWPQASGNQQAGQYYGSPTLRPRNNYRR